MNEKNKHFHVDVIPRDDHLSSNGADLDFDIHDTERLRAHINTRETWINSLVEFSETRNQSNGACEKNTSFLHVKLVGWEWADLG